MLFHLERDNQYLAMLAGHAAPSTTQRYIEGA
jgi:hypothetical protein